MRYKLTGLEVNDFMCPEERKLRHKIFRQDNEENQNDAAADAANEKKSRSIFGRMRKKISETTNELKDTVSNMVPENIKDAGNAIKDKMPENLRNLNVSDAFNDGVQKALDKASEIALDVTKVTREGTYVRLTPLTHPRLFEIMRDVCDILDYQFEPDIYVYHQNDGYYLFPCGVDHMYLVISKRMLYEFDEDMLYYSFGNAISMIKAGHAKITFLTTYIPSAGLYMVPKALLLQFVHAADITSDRGGLLACQSFAAAVRCHLCEAGFPFELAHELFTTDEEANEYVRGYIEAFERMNKKLTGIFGSLGQFVQDINYVEAPANTMLKRMYEWYNDADGYRSIIRKYGSEEM